MLKSNPEIYGSFENFLERSIAVTAALDFLVQRMFICRMNRSAGRFFTWKR